MTSTIQPRQRLFSHLGRVFRLISFLAWPVSGVTSAELTHHAQFIPTGYLINPVPPTWAWSLLIACCGPPPKRDAVEATLMLLLLLLCPSGYDCMRPPSGRSSMLMADTQLSRPPAPTNPAAPTSSSVMHENCTPATWKCGLVPYTRPLNWPNSSSRSIHKLRVGGGSSRGSPASPRAETSAPVD
eukprot:1146468-Pelagomonas_calceolata.AAC.7